MSGPRRRRRGTPDRGLALLAALALGLYLVFLVLPLLLSLRSSFTNENPLRATNDFIGLRNYTEMAGDDQLRASLKVTLLLAFGVTVAANALGVGFAILLNRTSLSYRVMRTVAFLPQVLSGVIVGFVWQTILTQNGVLNTALMTVGILDEPYPWLGSPNAALLCIGVVVAWVLSGFTTVVYLAALQSIPLELHDMASLDGVRGSQRFRTVTWPMIAPGTTISVTISLITVLKLYDVIAVLTAGGPANSTQSTALYIVKLAFTSDRVGYASAVAMLLLALSALVALTVTGALRRREVSL
ncbi:sugar ABC transporter permease [Plantactinospora mayteni]|uniref:Bicyclomycin resistance protein n=1 Tax=Plantactinospora mayteni TaxID=566021 RepID=A0ABQ4F114_9ACTN|nr:sugar ABC transporter permease [Plantactinospora mayteni]GIH00585.1 bicyclomycin resistance protein [Plantactinospora mayteni]